MIYFPAGEPAPHAASGVWQVDYSLPGNYTQDPNFAVDPDIDARQDAGVGHPLPALMDIELLADEKARAIACFGDSITEMRLWTDPPGGKGRGDNGGKQLC